jgi:peptidoglycan/LPS O-acetylase OafA/YrhL
MAVVKGYRPDLDGMRAIGMIQVMAYHFEVGAFEGAAIYVDMFFALSGYLITGLLLEERAKTGSVNLVAFYLRRAFRLLPALLLLLTVGATVFALALPSPNRNHTLIVGGLIAAFYVTNIVSYTHYTSWSTYVWLWTLSMEEQFYLLWPTALRRITGSGKRMRVILAIVVIASLLLAVLTAKGSPPPDRNAVIGYFQPQAHVFSLMIGCAAALVQTPRWFRHLALPAFAGLLALGLLSPLKLDANYLRFNIPATAITTVVLMLALEHQPRGPVGAILGWKPLTRIGIISYGLYLFHPIPFPILETKLHRAHWVIVVLSFAITWAAAELSYRFYEAPIRRWGRDWLKRRYDEVAGDPKAGKARPASGSA